MSAIIEQKTYPTGYSEYYDMLIADLTAAYNWDSVVADTWGATSSKTGYYGSSTSTGIWIPNSGGSVTRNIFTIEDLSIIVERLSTYTAFHIKNNIYSSEYFLPNNGDTRNSISIVKHSNGFIIQIGLRSTDTQTTNFRQPVYIGVAPATDPSTQEKTTAVFMLWPWDYNTWFMSSNHTILTSNSTKAGQQHTTVQWNVTGSITAHPIYGIGSNDVLDNYLCLERIPDSLFHYVGRVQYNNTNYYRLGHILVPYDD